MAVATPNPPKRPGLEIDQVVQHKGEVWQWQDPEGGPGTEPRWVHIGEAKGTWANLPEARDALDPPGGRGGGGRPAEQGLSADDLSAEDPGELQNVPGGGRRWKVGNRDFIAYRIPGTDDDPVWLVYKVETDGQLSDITADGAVKPDRVMDDFGDLNVIRAGGTRELLNLDSHPWDGWLARYNEAAGANPMLRDDEVLALFAASWLETGSAPSQEALEQTEWWESRTDTERQAVRRYGTGTDSAQFAEDFAAIQAQVEEDLIAKGFDFTDDNRERVVRYLAREVVWGRLTEDEYQRTVEQMSNSYDPNALPTAGFERGIPGEAVRFQGRTYRRIDGRDYALAKGLETAQYGAGAKKVDSVNEAGAFHDHLPKLFGRPAQGRDAQGGIETVRRLVAEWGGPLVANGFSEQELAQWAADIEQAEDPSQVEQVLIGKLRNRRMVLYPQYTDPNMTYEDIAAPYRGLVQSVWGQRMDESDQLFQSLLQANDVGQATHMLRREGRRRGVRGVVNDFASQAAQLQDAGVRRSVV